MAEKELVIREKLDHTGIFDFKAFYSFAHSWFVEEKYGVDEERYSEKVTGNSRDISIDWTATKQFSDYFKSEQKITFEISNLTEVEVEIDKERKKMNKGKISVTIKGAIIKDPNSKWEKSPFSRFMRDVYNKYVIPSRVFDMRQIVTGDAQGFKEATKNFLELTARRQKN